MGEDNLTYNQSSLISKSYKFTSTRYHLSKQTLFSFHIICKTLFSPRFYEFITMSYGEFTIIYDLVIVLLCIIILIFAVTLVILCKKTPIEAEDESIPLTRISASVYSLMEIDGATDGFNHRRIIGKGRLGTVYAAVMPKGELVAVKRIHPRLVLTNAGFGFSSILKCLSLAHHPHVVPITGKYSYKAS